MEGGFQEEEEGVWGRPNVSAYVGHSGTGFSGTLDELREEIFWRGSEHLGGVGRSGRSLGSKC